jgi:hypothetical protein
MKVSKNGQSYDTANGSEQPFAESNSTSLDRRQARQAAGQWSDDGGAALSEPALLDVVLPADKPAWSVLPLADLKDAILREVADEPARRRRDREHARLQFAHKTAYLEERAALALRDQYRNPWENT